MATDLSGRVAVITGASSGLGRHFAHLLADAGAAVALMARRTDRLEHEVAAIKARGGHAAAFALDVSHVAAIGPALEMAQEALGPLSILVNNAGVSGDGRALDMTVDAYDQAMNVNVRGVYFAAREAARRMMDNGEAAAGRARIVNIASIAATKPLAGLSVYCASKAAVAMLTQALAREWAKPQIAVNALCPGYIQTEINGEWFASEAGQRQVKGFPRQRLMDETALDEALLMLCGDAAGVITGSLITVDDGQTL